MFLKSPSIPLFQSGIITKTQTLFFQEIPKKSIPRLIYDDINVSRFVIPGLTRNPVFSIWIPAFAGMTVPKLL
ncbi:MAG: hypothetical protein A2026_10490 [Deltaproteobacteria bacterium RBG_19FT_COMBO_46_12]|nr:MAG: hypothetical protein A2026_10490 [Deltaproteobacteria bacterium RBG_19FT_COMBO_46_12]